MDYKLISPIKTSSIVEQIFYNRGFSTKEDIHHYLNLTQNDDLGFNNIDNIHKGAQMLIKHIAAGDKIFIQVDPDVDGYTSAAILINYLHRLFPDTTKNNVYYRIQDGKEHGLILDSIAKDVFKLVIAPDSSSNEYDIHTELKNAGIDVLVIDHHNAEKVSEDACIINNQLCSYENKTLSGAGMVYKFCQYLDKINGTNIADDFVDLAALGIVSDMMDIRNFETRYFINKGINNIINPFFYEMIAMNSFSLKDKVTPNGIAFYITPYINACIRTGSPEEKMVMFEAMLEFKANEKIPSTKRGEKGLKEACIIQACRNCKNAKNRQKTSQDKAVDLLERIIKEKNLLDNKVLLVQIEEDIAIDKNLTGLIANKFMDKYQRPVLILRKTHHDGEIYWEGSGRGYTKSGFMNFQGFLKDFGLFEYVDGHENAFGRGIKDIHIPTFIDYSNAALKDTDFNPCYNVDFIFNNKTIKTRDIKDISNLEHLWGQGMAEPLIALENIKIKDEDIFLLKGSTLKFSIQDTFGDKIEFIKFGSNEDEFNKLKTNSLNGCTQLDIIGICSINSYMGIDTPQIKIKDFEIKHSFLYDF